MASGTRRATFDCYGTLIDWNGGIGRELERLFGAARGGELLGLRTIWINRLGEEAEPQPDVELRNLTGLGENLDLLLP